MSHIPDDIRAVVFDLADVLFDFAGRESLAQLSGGRIGPAEFSRLWSSPLADALYRGDCTPDDFAIGAVAQLGLPVSPDMFLRAFAAWFRGPFPGAFELVEQVRARAIVACLSNTNPIDVARFRAELDIDRRFDRCFFSNEIGLRKPDRKCFRYVLERLGFSQEPRHVILFDDNATNVEAACAVGLRAYEVRGPAEVQSCLSSLGLLSASVRLARSER
jgi:HAD superfamily hydrolase (TIGR01509 family)